MEKFLEGKSRQLLFLSVALASLLLACTRSVRSAPPTATAWPSPQPVELRWDSDPSALVIRWYSPYTTAGLIGSYDKRYYIPEAQVWGDGRIVWTSHERAKRRVQEGRLSVAQMEALLRGFIDAGFLQWEDAYQTLGGYSMPPVHLALNLAGRSKEVSEHGGAPEAYYELERVLANGAGVAARDYVPARGYLSAAPLDIDLQAPEWPSEAGISLQEVGEGRYVQGEALAFAWEMVNRNPTGPVYVKSEGRAYAIMVQVPGLSFFPPPP